VLRLTSSIRQGTVTASLILRKLGSYPRQSGLALALRELGRIERTLFMLEWLQNPALRRRVHAGLNKVNLAVVAIVAWNTVYLERAVAVSTCRGKDRDRLTGSFVALGWEHINLTGDYVWHSNKRRGSKFPATSLLLTQLPGKYELPEGCILASKASARTHPLAGKTKLRPDGQQFPRNSETRALPTPL
jgi:Tn3 transposase DDE domain